jgi:outer membrane protein assembly factor BamB
MTVRVRCPNAACGRTADVPEEYRGSTLRCQHCGHRFVFSADVEAGAASPTAPAFPSQIGRFQIRSRLGGGAFGTVYRAFDPALERDVAVKVPRDGTLDSPAAVQCFLREGKAAAQLHHPHIVPVYEAGQDGSHPFLVSAFIEGRTLAQAIDAGPFDCRRAAGIVRDLAEALEHAHGQGIVHRDVKSANVLLDDAGHAYLADFGLAHLREQASRLTRRGAVLGTPAYLAPEQARGWTGQALPASDQYSLGVVLYELLCGRTPFAGPPDVVLYNAVHHEPPPPRSVRPEVPAELERICLKALAKKPERRHASCQELADELRRWLAGEPIRTPPEPAPEVRHGWRKHLAVVACAVTAVGLPVIGLALVSSRWGLTETPAAIRERAEADYQAGQFAKAAKGYSHLCSAYPGSPEADDDAAKLELSTFRSQAESAGLQAEAAPDLADRILNDDRPEPWKSKQRELAKDYGLALKKLIEKVADDLKGRKEVGNGQDLLKRARETLAVIPSRLPGALSEQQQSSLNDTLQQAADHLVVRLDHHRALADLKKLAEHPSGRAVKEAAALVARQARQEPGFDQGGEMTDLRKQLQDGHLRSIVYTQATPPPGAGHGEDQVPSLLVAQRIDVGADPGGRDDGSVVFALARGVLYALSQKTGRIVWAMRVGIDFTTLPVRVPASGARPEMVLVPSTDTETLLALNVATGDQLWKYRLGAPCVGQPLIDDQRAYLPTYDGKVHEIELVGGKPLGWFDLGKGTRLTVGGARQEDTNLLYFPADEHCVYVLDVANHRCQTILYTQHLAGTLRSEPILATTPGGAAEGYLILCLADGFQNTTLRVFGLPIDSPNKPPLRLNPEPRLPGWPWFGPFQDPEKLVLATDAGEVGVFGIRQPGNIDNALFPWLPKEFRVAPGPGSRPGRAQVVHAQEDDIWVIVHGALHRLKLGLDPGEGRQLLHVWRHLLPVGSPLHRSQVDRGRETLFVVTQSLTRQQCLATAVDAETGQVRWQRQLGLVCRGQPVVLGEQVLALDQAGGVFAFSPAGHPPPKNPDEAQWGVGGQPVARPLAFEDNPAFPSALYPAGDGATAYQVALSARGDEMLVRRFGLNAKGDGIDLKDEKSFSLAYPPAGLPAVGPDELLLPLEDGALYGVRLPAGTPDMSTPAWRAGRPQAGMRCQLAWVTAGQFLTSDGSRGLTLWKRDPRGWQASRANPDIEDPTAKLPARVVAPPAILPPLAGKIQVCVADADGGLSLLAGDDLAPVRRWNRLGKLSAGPFVYGSRVGCVVDRSLVWIDPTQDEPSWKYPAQEEIVGRPQLLDGMLVVADRSGRFVGLDTKTGKEAGKGYTVKASTAPAAGVAPFGKDRAFAPLTDGTVMLLPSDHLRPEGK